MVNKPILVSVLPNYYNRQDGVSINELIKRALESNQDLAAARLEIEKAKARLPKRVCVRIRHSNLNRNRED